MKIFSMWIVSARSRAWGMAFLAIGLGAVVTSGSGRAATFCIAENDVAGLQGALATGAGNGEDDLIELQIGDYDAGSVVLGYPAVTEHHDLIIEGGYSANFGNPCGTPPASPDARLTTLHGGLWRMQLASGVGSITVKSVAFDGAFSSDASHAPIEIAADPLSTGNIYVENVMFVGNGSFGTYAIYLLAGNGAVSVRNTLFAANTSFGGVSPIRVGSRLTGSIGALIVNSTFSGNTSTLPALDVYTPNTSAIVANDIFWSNQPGGGVSFDSPQNAFLVADDLADITEATGTQSDGLLSVDPQFDVYFSLKDASPLRDRGNTGSAVFGPGTFDVTGAPRVYHNELPDIGAYEIQDVIFAHGFDYQLP